MTVMPTRPEAHVKDTASYKRLLNLLPDDWVVRPIFPDYGIDYEIEIWHKGKPINKKLNLQVKNNDTVHLEVGFNKSQIKISALNYLAKEPNPFLATFLKNDIAIYYVPSILKTVAVKNGAKMVTLPLTLKRDFPSYQYEMWFLFENERFFFPLLGKDFAKKLIPRFRKNPSDEINDEANNYYTINVNDTLDETEYFLREEYANFGFYHSTLKKNFSKPIQFLLAKLKDATKTTKRGIIEGLSHLMYQDESTSKIALGMIKSNNSQDVLVGLMHLAKKGDETYRKMFENYALNPNISDAIIEDDERHGVARVCVDALFRIQSPESLKFLTDSILLQGLTPTELFRVYQLFEAASIEIQKTIFELIRIRFPEKNNFDDFHKTLDHFYNLGRHSNH